MIKVAIIVVAILVVANVFSPEPDCSYSNDNGSFTFSEMNFKERNFRNCQSKFELFKKQNSQHTSLYRLCSKKFWQFWNYKRYFFSEKYKLPYANWETIEQRRGAAENKTGFQDF